jgi:hypothetical protein
MFIWLFKVLDMMHMRLGCQRDTLVYSNLKSNSHATRLASRRQRQTCLDSDVTLLVY